MILFECFNLYNFIQLDYICLLRIYPPAFGDAICRLLPDLSAGEGCPEVDESEPAEEVFERMAFSTWEEAHLIPCLKYLRGNRHLNLPVEWVQAFPRPLEILHRMEQSAN